MKTIYKRLLTIVLVFALAISFTPIRTLAAKDNNNDKGKKEKVEYGTVVKANSGTISTIMYPGAKAKKASFKITSEKGDRYIDTNNNNKEYDCYEVTITLNKSKLSSKDINKSLYDYRKKKGTLQDYAIIMIDKDGKSAKGIKVDGGINEYLSSAPQQLKAKDGKKTNYFGGWRKIVVYTFRIMVPENSKGVYVGVAGLRNGQLTKDTKKQYQSDKINFYKAGYGNNNRGYCYVKRIN